MRVLSLLVLALAVWTVGRNVSLDDTLLIGDVRLHGELRGEWRSEEVEFQVAPQQAQSTARLPIGFATALESTARDGGPVRARADALIVEGIEVPNARGTRIAWSPGIPHALQCARWPLLVQAFLSLVLSTLFVVTRWWRLLRLEGCDVRWGTAFRFTYVGLFFNSFIPGLNGGDVARAVAVVRDQPENRSSALMTVVIDRAFGLIAMVLMATVVVGLGDARFASLKVPVIGFCAAMLVGLGLYLAPRVRELVRFEALLARLPHGARLARLDGAARRLLGHPGEVLVALLLSFGNHVTNALAIIWSAEALGSALGVQDWLAIMTIANTLAALPISPGGLGVGEVLFGSLAQLLGGSYVLGVATCLLYRVELLGLAVLGGLVMMLGGAGFRARVAEARQVEVG